MRFVMLTLTLLGCAPVCPGPSQVDGTWEVLANVLSRTGGDEPTFPAESSPTNGTTVWAIAWGADPSGPVDLSIDGQGAEAVGAWSSSSCGSFDLTLQGTYERDGATHTYDAAGAFLVFDDTLVGTWDWSEQWRAATDETGLLTARGQLRGARR